MQTFTTYQSSANTIRVYDAKTSEAIGSVTIIKGKVERAYVYHVGCLTEYFDTVQEAARAIYFAAPSYI